MFVYAIVSGISTWHKNNKSPRLKVAATIISKRTEVDHHRHANAGDITGASGYSVHTSTTYYIGFEFETGDRLELKVPGSEYGILREGDTGKLMFQGTRYLGFERN